MALYKVAAGTINGIDYRNCGAILTVNSNYIRIRFAGDSTPFIECKFEDLCKSDESPFTDLATFITYWNANFVPLVIAT